MDKTDLCFTPATELAGAIRAKKLSSVEITSTVLERIKSLEPKLNGFAHLAAEEAMDAAAKADTALAKGQRLDRCSAFPSPSRTSNRCVVCRLKAGLICATAT